MGLVVLENVDSLFDGELQQFQNNVHGLSVVEEDDPQCCQDSGNQGLFRSASSFEILVSRFWSFFAVGLKLKESLGCAVSMHDLISGGRSLGCVSFADFLVAMFQRIAGHFLKYAVLLPLQFEHFGYSSLILPHSVCVVRFIQDTRVGRSSDGWSAKELEVEALCGNVCAVKFDVSLHLEE